MKPRATYRLQLHKDFTFADAARLIPYLADLGISHLYLSPILAARPGSAHGYDVIDPTRVNPELGGEEGLRNLVGNLRRAHLGLIVDIVPNHMHAGPGNEWWCDLLRHGNASAYAKFFDIDWGACDGKLLLPILGRPYGEALTAGEVKREGDAIRYFDHVLPLAPGTSPADTLHDLLEQQNYRLAWWRTASDQINWRRFFDINDLVAMRVEDPDVFEATHATLLRLYREGMIDGMRIDHIDGLTDPGGYCRNLRERLLMLDDKRPKAALAGPAYLVVEKILSQDEQLPSAWRTDGTTGYDFMDQVSAVLHHQSGEAILTGLWKNISGRTASFDEEASGARRELLEQSFEAPLGALVASLATIAQRDLATRDFTAAAIRRCVIEVLAHFGVYRTYPDKEESNAEFLGRAIDKATRSRFADRLLLQSLGHWLGVPNPALARAQTLFQQLSAPLAAKAIEDTAFYRYGRLLSRNDVGFDPARFAATPGHFHEAIEARQSHFPHAMLATATHDHKRGEDVRARLAVLSERPHEWAAAVAKCMTLNAGIRRTINGMAAPSPGDEAMLYQMIVGAWPLELRMEDGNGLSAYAERLSRWLLKAERESKLQTGWIAPDQTYEQATDDFLRALFSEQTGALNVLAQFARQIGPAGAINGLTQLVLKLTTPGVPDIYQGAEFWDLSLVDPDNRRAIDYRHREVALRAMVDPRQCLETWRDGRLKQAVTARILNLRRRLPELFRSRDYRPLAATGPHADHLIAFSCRHVGATMAVVVTRLPSVLLADDDRLTIAREQWHGNELILSDDVTGPVTENVLGQGPARLVSPMPVADVLCDLPFAVTVIRPLGR
jgi:(1->4)-alpha-D-glucan 1-alpha-D-glucosylmutase